ncbi:fasciclin domain-containing protein [Pedobacter ghigonis]|uniref:fasciclin domain-containing protein n=1 Tax=Pedobacter ghigonis TaxID=2730403 RepID=UPI00158CF68B|nr:fasciclin domain-containing protein [Pedobacter ghigonis]
MKNKNIKLVFAAIALLLATACNKEYYVDSGVLTPTYNGTILQYLKSKPAMFDTTVRVIALAGMNDVLDKENLTFFAPTSSSIYKSVRALNAYLIQNGRDTVRELSQIKREVWRKTLSQYIFKGTNRLKDYPQLDTLAYTAFPGQSFSSYENGRIMNIGVIFNDAVSGSTSIKYAGYRQLFLSYIKDFTKPQQSLVNIPVATSDIAPSNGIIHVLRQATLSGSTLVNKHNFGFVNNIFINDVLASGITPIQ